MNKVDYIFPWVNPQDEEWLKEYNKVCKSTEYFNLSYQDWGLLKYKFRSLAENMPWINSVKLIVSSKSQLPTWLNTKTVDVVYHKDFIPKKFLPTFNSCTIEMFLPKIKGISNLVIYGNDDTFIMKPTSFNDFYNEKNLPNISYTENNSGANFLKIPKNSTNFVKKELGLEIGERYIVPQHYCVPWNLDNIKDFYNKNESIIKESITSRRDVDKNYSQYLFTIYQVLSNNSINEKELGKLNDMIGINKKEVFQDILEPTHKLLCINDSDINDMNLIEKIQKTFEKVFPNKCKYEK